MHVSFTLSFLKMLKQLPERLRDEAIEKIELFHNPEHHARLKGHKLRGRLLGRYSFSVNYKTRIVFRYLKTEPREALLTAIGDHDIYKE